MTGRVRSPDRHYASIWKSAGFSIFGFGSAYLCLSEPYSSDVIMMFSALREPPGRYLVILAGLGALCLASYGLIILWNALRGVPLVEVNGSELVIGGIRSLRIGRNDIEIVTESAGSMFLKLKTTRRVHIPVNFCIDPEAARTTIRRFMQVLSA